MSLLKWETNTQRCKYSQNKLIQADTPGQRFALPPNDCRQWLGGSLLCKLNGKKISKSWGARSPGEPFTATPPLARRETWPLMCSSTQKNSSKREAMGDSCRGNQHALDVCHPQLNLSCKWERLAYGCTVGRGHTDILVYVAGPLTENQGQIPTDK